MPSSISSSKGVYRSHYITVAAVFLILITAEGIARVYVHRRCSHIDDHKDIASLNARMARVAARTGFHVIFVGNSTTAEGIDVSVAGQALKQAGVREPVVEECAVGASSIRDWYWMLEHCVWRPGRHVDFAVVTFFGYPKGDARPANVDDRSGLDYERLATFLTDVRDWPELFTHDIDSIGDGADYLGALISTLFAMRQVTRDKIMKAVIPHFVSGTEAQHALLDAELSGGAAPKELPPTYHTLKRMLAAASKHGTRLCFVAYPWQGYYQIDPVILATIRAGGGVFIDMRQNSGLSPSDYQDTIHLNGVGRPVFTRQVAAAIAPLCIRESSRSLRSPGV